MIIKKYRASSVEEAQSLVRKELGPDAIILTTSYLKENGLKGFFSTSKVEVTAAVEEEELAAYQAKINFQSDEQLLSQLRQEQASQLQDEDKMVTQGGDLVSLSSAARKKIQAANSVSQDINHLAAYKPVVGNDSTVDAAVQQPSKAQAEHFIRLTQNLVTQFGQVNQEEVSKPVQKIVFTEPSFANHSSTYEKSLENKANPINDSVQDLMALRNIIREELNLVQKNVTPTWTDKGLEGSVLNFLLDKGVKHSVATMIEGRIHEEFGPDYMAHTEYEKSIKINSLKRELARLFNAGKTIQFQENQRSVVALVGATGVGKTMAAMRLGLRYQRSLRKKVAIISIDPYQNKNEEYLLSLIPPHSDINVMIVENMERLNKALESFEDKDLVIIDTSSINPYDECAIENLQQYLETIDDLQLFLTLSATTKDVDTYGIIKSLSVLEPQGIIMTKLDETIAYGILINVCNVAAHPISYVTTGNDISEDLVVADKHDLARRLLVKYNDTRSKHVRELAMK
ncbi:MAG: flhF [Chlamydiales bacterium]|jgi:flagellar biosynthesis protein FlhF|nr:flhF [Chlamydiales bacterium]